MPISTSTNRSIIIFILLISIISAQGIKGYYQNPTIHNNIIIFNAEGDLWNVPIEGGLASRLTTHAENERFPRISPDGKTVAFTASYEGPSEVYTMSIYGGLPKRWTYESSFSKVNSWTPSGNILYDTREYSTLPDRQLLTINTKTYETNQVPLSQASEGTYSGNGKTVFFVRPSDHFNVTKRYMGGTARQIWKYTTGEKEAVKLTTKHLGESHHPTWHNGRIYFLSDRDSIMNIWSMTETGTDFVQHTKHAVFDVQSIDISDNNIVYSHGADIWIHSLESKKSNKLNITLRSDNDQHREKWVTNPKRYITSAKPSNNGEKIVLTSRGRIFVAPVKSGRFVEISKQKDVRYRNAFFSKDDNYIYALSDKSGEFEFVKFSANGLNDEQQITSNGKILRYGGNVSPNGKWIAFDDLNKDLYLLNIKSGKTRKISTNNQGIGSFSWSPDNRWIVFDQYAENSMRQLIVYNLQNKSLFPITTDRANSYSAKWSPNGKFIYFISDRHFETLVGSPWGSRQPEPFFNKQDKLYVIPLRKGDHSPFKERNELVTVKKKSKKKKNLIVRIDKSGIEERMIELPVNPGNYSQLFVTEKAIYMKKTEIGESGKSYLSCLKITNESPKLKNVVAGISRFTVTNDHKKILVVKNNNYYMTKAGTSKISDLNKSEISLKYWKFKLSPKDDWRQIFTDAWRMERDYFYDKNMHGVNWKSMFDRYQPLLERVTTRDELSNLIGRMIGELSVLHTSVRGGDRRNDNINITVPSLGAKLSRKNGRKGYRIDYIYKADPDYPLEKSPLDDSSLDIKVGDIITKINGVSSLSEVDIHALLRDQANKQVRLTLKRGSNTNDFIIKPMRNGYNLRYRDWEYSRRLEVEKKTNKKVGYVHLRSMGSSDINQWYREFYPIYNRSGLIIDVRHNRGGNIDSFILEKLLRKAWMYWQFRTGNPSWNMQYAFRGHIVVLVNEQTASDDEAFSDGFKKLSLGTTIGKRTWGGEVWLHSGNRLSDNGLARAPMMGVYDEKGNWLIEDHGFEPDIEVDNLPHETFNGKDAQLNTAIDFLKKKIKKDPRSVPAPPKHPDKSFRNK